MKALLSTAFLARIDRALSAVAAGGALDRAIVVERSRTLTGRDVLAEARARRVDLAEAMADAVIAHVAVTTSPSLAPLVVARFVSGEGLDVDPVLVWPWPPPRDGLDFAVIALLDEHTPARPRDAMMNATPFLGDWLKDGRMGAASLVFDALSVLGQKVSSPEQVPAAPGFWPIDCLAVLFLAERAVLASPLGAALSTVDRLRAMVQAAEDAPFVAAVARVLSALAANKADKAIGALAGSPDARGAWPAALRAEARRLGPALLSTPSTGDTAEALARLEAFAAEVGQRDPDTATMWRAKVERTAKTPAALWALWLSDWLPALARSMWPKWRADAVEAARRRTVAEPVATVDALIRVLASPVLEVDDSGVHLRDRYARPGVDRVLLAPDALPFWMGMDEALVQSIAAHRWLRWLLAEVRAAYASDGVDRSKWAPVITVQGGFAALEALGIGDRKRLAKIVPAFAFLPIPHPTRRGEKSNLYAYEAGEEARGQRRGYFKVTAGTLLHPHAGLARDRWDRGYIPIPDLPPLDGVLGRANEHGRLATLQLLVVREIAGAGGALIREGGAHITPERWAALIASSGLPSPLTEWKRIPDAWTAGGDDSGPFLERVGRDRYHLHPEHLGPRAFLDEGASKSLQGEAAARARAANRERAAGRPGK